MSDEQNEKDESGGSGYTVNADGSITFDGEPSEETRKAAQAEVEKAAAERDAQAEEAAKAAGEEARKVNAQAEQAQGAEQEQAPENTTTERETAEGGMAREKGTV
jgi:hypothetical protein